MGKNYYRMFPEYNFAVVKIQSNILEFEELKKLNHEYKSDPDYSNIHYLLIMVDKKSKLNFSIKDLQKLSDLYNTEYQKNNHKIIVWLVAYPRITALTHLFVLDTKDNSHYCSTLNKAFNILDMSIDFEKFKKLIK